LTTVQGFSTIAVVEVISTAVDNSGMVDEQPKFRLSRIIESKTKLGSEEADILLNRDLDSNPSKQ
jgi:hypothetical protein